MNENTRALIAQTIAPLLEKGELSLLLGAGFSLDNLTVTEKTKLPDGDELKIKLLAACGKAPGPKTSLKDAYQYAKNNLQGFDEFFSGCFTVNAVEPWQRKIFEYVWGRIYTTNVDNVLNIAHRDTEIAGLLAGTFKFYNYIDEGLAGDSIGTIPVVTIHGTCQDFNQGFIFSSLEYAKQSSRILDWHNDLASRILTGGMIIVGSSLNESDLDIYIARRKDVYGDHDAPRNWLVGPDPDPIRAANLRSAGFAVIDATAAEFLTALFSFVRPRSISDIVVENLPSLKRAMSNKEAMIWFRASFSLVIEQIERAKNAKGITRHFLTGEDPEWFYIVNDVHAETQHGNELTAKIAALLAQNTNGIGILHVIGPSGSGKTTAIRNALRQISSTYPSVFEFRGDQGLDKKHLRSIVENVTTKAIFTIYGASDFYFAIKEAADRLQGREKPYCLFILEDRSNDYSTNKGQLSTSGISKQFCEFGALQHQDAINIARKIEIAGLTFDNFSEYNISRRAGILIDKEKGFGGDLLSALFSLTSGANFERRLFEDYNAAKSELARAVLDVTSLVHSLGFKIPINYIAGALNKTVQEVEECIFGDLAGVVIVRLGDRLAQCRHRIIASYYYEQFISGRGGIALMIGMLSFLSRQFTIADIKTHPLPYRIYRELISFEFLYDSYFNPAERVENCDSIYHAAQNFFGTDGIFWLHYGRFYRKTGRLAQAIECFRTGLDFYESFQTRHSLGLALVESYLDGGNVSEYEEGIDLLEQERLSRAGSDPYPTATLLQLLTKAIRRDPSNVDAIRRAKDCCNFGIKHFGEDAHFRGAMRDYLQCINNTKP